MSAKPRVSDWLLERLHRGELSEAQAEQVRRDLEAAGEGQRLEALAKSDEEILTAYPPRVVMAEVHRRAAGSRRNPRLLILPFATALLAMGGVLLMVRVPVTPVPDAETITIKGLSPMLRVYRKTNTGSVPLGSGALVRRGDVLQVAYVAAARRHGVVASVDGRGNVTLHLPEQPGQAASLQGGGEHALPHSFELDDSPGFERFVFVTSDNPFSTDEAVRALKDEAAPSAGLGVVRLMLKKEMP